jgi:hypothetical protein
MRAAAGGAIAEPNRVRREDQRRHGAGVQGARIAEPGRATRFARRNR